VTTEALLILSGVLAAGCFVETVAGFGGTILALALGAPWFSIEQMLALFLPVNMLLSVTLAVRGRAAIQAEALRRRILPLVFVGLIAGTALAWVIVAERARIAFAALVVAVAIAELVAQLQPPAADRPPRPRREQALLLGAGLTHGLFATGGPLAVAALARTMPSKAAMRATLAVLWLSLNVLVLGRLAIRGDLDADTLVGSLMLLPGFAAGLVAGELVHGAVGEVAFRRAIAALLLACAALVLASSI
jgi:uncharacterized membrane protein YfcA